MPKTKRDYLKRACAQSVNHLATSIKRLDYVRTEFADVHPAETEMLVTIMEGINMNREVTLKFVAAMWGIDEDGLMAYLSG